MKYSELVNPATWVTRRSGLLEPFTVPELTIDEAISRGWEQRGPLMQPKRDERFFRTFPPPYPPWGWHLPRIPWDDAPVNDFIRHIVDGLHV